MILSYRGAHYTSESYSPEMVDSNVVGQYRGQKFHLQYPRHIPVPQPVMDLQYRGAAYRTTVEGGILPRVAVDSQAVAARLPEVTPRSASTVRRVDHTPIDRQHQQNIQQRLQQRIAAAKAKGDDVLLRQLENESQLLA